MTTRAPAPLTPFLVDTTMQKHHRPSSRASSLAARGRLALVASLLLGLGLPAAGCDSGTTGSSNPIEGDWEVSLYQGDTLPEASEPDPYSGATSERRGEMSLFDDMTGYIDIITEQVWSEGDETYTDYRVWDARVFPEGGDNLTLRVNYRDNLIFLECVIGSGGSRLSCTDPESDPPDDPADPDPSAWEFIRVN